VPNSSREVVGAPARVRQEHVRRPRAADGIGISRHSSGLAPRASAAAAARWQALQIPMDSFGGVVTRLRPREPRRSEVAEQCLGSH